MDPNYRTIAKQHLEMAKNKLSTGVDEELAYAALSLRKCMEALTYDKAKNYKDDLPDSIYKQWQPRKLLASILKIDPFADKPSEIRIGIEKTPGVPAKEMKYLGAETPLSIQQLKKYYDLLGAFLHIPTIDQYENDKLPGYEKLKTKCNELIAKLEDVFSSNIHNSNLTALSSIECSCCGEKVSRRILHLKDNIDAECFKCGAEYILSKGDDNQIYWEDKTIEVRCPTENCDAVKILWLKDKKEGSWWQCEGCGGKNIITLGVMRNDNIKFSKDDKAK